MANPMFHVPCKIDGKEVKLGVQTHGNRAHPHCPIIRTEAQAEEHVRKLSQLHALDNETGEEIDPAIAPAGSFRYVHHIDGEGNEHTITDIGKAYRVDPKNNTRINTPGAPTAAQVHELADAPSPQ